MGQRFRGSMYPGARPWAPPWGSTDLSPTPSLSLKAQPGSCRGSLLVSGTIWGPWALKPTLHFSYCFLIQLPCPHWAWGTCQCDFLNPLPLGALKGIAVGDKPMSKFPRTLSPLDTTPLPEISDPAFFFFFLLFNAVPVAYGGSQARG